MIYIISAYILTAIIAYGGFFAFFQRTFTTIADEEYWTDMTFSMLLALFPIEGFVLGMILTNFYEKGFKFW